MVLYLLRHEIRSKEKIDFNTNLTFSGKHNSRTRLFNKLEHLQIDEIYSSPYKRTLDTIGYFSTTKNIPIKIDWALCEHLSKNERNNMKDLPFPNKQEQEKIHNTYLLDKEYTPTTDLEYIDTYNEDDTKFEHRIDNFILFLHTMLTKNILVVTHKKVCDKITERLVGNKKDIKMGQCLKLDFCSI